MTPVRAIANLEEITKAWLGTLAENFTYEKAAVAQQSLRVVKTALAPKPETPPAKKK